MELTKAERLILYMLADITEHLGIENGVKTALLKEVISGGHDWALQWEMPGVFPDHIDSDEDVRFVVDVLDMWNFIEASFGQMSDDQRQELKRRIDTQYDPTFPGFDGNNESSLIAIARLFIEHMDRWHFLIGRELNSHHSTVSRYRRMLEKYKPLRPTLANRLFNVDELSTLLGDRG